MAVLQCRFVAATAALAAEEDEDEDEEEDGGAAVLARAPVLCSATLVNVPTTACCDG
jgi:hypothetical protein